MIKFQKLIRLHCIGGHEEFKLVTEQHAGDVTSHRSSTVSKKGHRFIIKHRKTLISEATPIDMQVLRGLVMSFSVVDALFCHADYIIT
jgi:hypothetical protein